MDKIEVKKILERNTVSWYRDDKEAWLETVAKEICKSEPEDESGLLTDEDIKQFIISHGWILSPAKMSDMISQFKEFASIKDDKLEALKEVKEMSVDKLLLTPTEIGDHLTLEDGAVYPCSNGSSMVTFSVDTLLGAQIVKVLSDLKSQIEQIPDPPQDYIDDWLKGWRSCKKDILSKLQEETRCVS